MSSPNNPLARFVLHSYLSKVISIFPQRLLHPFIEAGLHTLRFAAAFDRSKTPQYNSRPLKLAPRFQYIIHSLSFQCSSVLNQRHLPPCRRVHFDELQFVVRFQAAQVLRRDVDELAVFEGEARRDELVQSNLSGDRIEEHVELVEHAERGLQVLAEGEEERDCRV